MKHFITLTALFLPVLLTGCSSHPKQPAIFSESLITTINKDGMKLFTYQLTLNMSNQEGMGGPGGSGRRPPGGQRPSGGNPGGGGTPGMGAPKMDRSNMGNMRRGMEQDAEKTVIARLEEQLAATKYCENGYFIIDQKTMRGAGVIYGECKAASLE